MSPKKIPDNIKSILIVRLSAIGDVIHALPVLNELRKKYPDAKIGWIVEELSAPLLENHPQLDKVYVIPKKRWKKDLKSSFFKEMRPFFQKVKADGWDVAIDLQGLTKSGLVAYSSGAKYRIGYGDHDGREINKVFTNHKVNPDKSAFHVVARNLELLRPLQIEPDHETPGVIGILDEEKQEIRSKLEEAGWDAESKLVALNPGAGWPNKKWPPSNFAALGKMLFDQYDLYPVIFWGPGEESLRDEILAGLKDSSTPGFAAPKTTVRELAVMISVMNFFVGGDTGPTHMAGMFGVPTVSIFGASDGHRNRPWPVNSSLMIQREAIDCVPCWKRECPLAGEEYIKCLTQISTDDVMKNIIEHFGETLS